MIPLLTAHLWQSTFFAVAAGLLTVAFRKNQAQVRYWLWLSASLKFFVPFALLVSAGSYLETWIPAAHRIATRITTPAVSYTIEQFSQPVFSESVQPAPATPDTIHWVPVAIFGVWLCGFLAIALIRFQNWLRIRIAVRASTATDIPATVQVRLSPGLLEPGVVGLLHPVLLLPEGITERLTPCELAAVIAHEMCHIRRRDNLFASIHMIVEAMFWFHPLVWWIGVRLVEERERACDEEVLSLGNEPDVYADAILNVCKLYVESPLACVSGMSGASIRRRIEAIMSNRAALRLNRAKKFLLASAGVLALAGPVAIGLIVGVGDAPVIRAQTAAPEPHAASRPKFDVVSVRRCNPNGLPGPRSGEGGGRGTGPQYSPGRIRMQCMTVGAIIHEAYLGLFGEGDGLLNYMPSIGDDNWLRKAPGWVDSDLYTVEGKTDDPAAKAVSGRGRGNGNIVLERMLQVALEDRFQLRLHQETQDVPMYNLTVAKGGLRLKPMARGGCSAPDPSLGTVAPRGVFMSGEWSPAGKTPPCMIVLHTAGPDWALDAAGQTPGNLIGMLSKALDRHVFDKTGITDLYTFHLRFAHDGSTPGNLPPAMIESMFPHTDVPSGPSIFTALGQVGLKLEPTGGPRGHFVIDRIERPSAN